MASEPTLYPKDVEVMGWVAELQRLLADQGFPSSDPQGEFGDDTERAVRAFQEANGCDVDGIVGNQTWSALYGRDREPEGKNNDPYGDTREGGEGGGGDAGSGEVPPEVVAQGYPASWSQWTDEQKQQYLTLNDGDLMVRAEAEEMGEVLAIRETDEGEEATA